MIDDLYRYILNGQFKEAADIAWSIHIKCNTAEREKNPHPLAAWQVLKHFEQMPWRKTPACRVFCFMRRISRHRVIYAKQANRIICLLCNRFSGNPSVTGKACELYESEVIDRYEKHTYRANHRWSYGKQGFDVLTDWDFLERMARRDKAQFCRISDKRNKQFRLAENRLAEVIETKNLIKQLRKEMKNVENAQNMR